MIVMKFGGTSMGSPSRIRDVARIVCSRSEKRIVVVSAMAGTTNELLSVVSLLKDRKKDEAQQRIGRLKGAYEEHIASLLTTQDGRLRSLQRLEEMFSVLHQTVQEDYITDYEERCIVAIGEQLSSKLLTEHLTELGMRAVERNALGFMRIDHRGLPDMDFIEKQSASLAEDLGADASKRLIDSADIVITQGFICQNAYGETDNLQRGGSDYTATLLGAARGASLIEIWTDVNGVHTCDPRYVRNTSPIAHLHYDEAISLACNGAKVLHPICVVPAKERGIPIRLLNTLAPTEPGTLIDGIVGDDTLKAIAIKTDMMIITLGLAPTGKGQALRDVCQILTRHTEPLQLLSGNNTNIMLSISKHKAAPMLVEELSALGGVSVEDAVDMLTIVGDAVGRKLSAITHKVSEILLDYPILALSADEGENAVHVICRKEDTMSIAQQLNDGLFL